VFLKVKSTDLFDCEYFQEIDVHPVLLISTEKGKAADSEKKE
jgi:hypothetical protein